MEQYSPKNQLFLTAEAAHRGMPQPTDVRSFKQWKLAGRSVIKGEKALHVWIPKRGKAVPTELAAATGTASEATMRQYFVRGPVFDISQTKPCAPRHRAAANTDRQFAAEEDAYNRARADYDAAISAGDIPADLDFEIWRELRDETQLAVARGEIPASTANGGMTIATTGHDGNPCIIAEYQHVYAPIGGGSQELDTEEETASAVSSSQQHEARITFYNAAGHRLQDINFATLREAYDAFDTLESGEGIDLPADWLTATLERFINHSPYTERATYRHTGALTSQYRAEFLEIGTRSYQWSSHTPEKNAAFDFDGFARMISKQSYRWHAKATTPELHALADTLAAEYAAGYMAQYRTVAAARSRVASSFVTGPAGFNHRRNQKAQATYAKRYDELDAWLQRFQKTAAEQFDAATPADDRITRKLKAVAKQNLIMCGQIDAGKWPGFNRQSFANSTASRIRTAHKRGHTVAVAAVLAWLKEEQTNLLATDHLKTPMLTDRHSIWALA